MVNAATSIKEGKPTMAIELAVSEHPWSRASMVSAATSIKEGKPTMAMELAVSEHPWSTLLRQ